METITVSALFLTALCLIEWLHHKEKESLLQERKSLLDRIQAGNYIDYKKMEKPVEIKPKEAKKPIQYL